jgi:hypothetical protein
MRSLFFGLSNPRSLHLDAKAIRAAIKPPSWPVHISSLTAQENFCRRTCTEAAILHAVLLAQKHVNPHYGPHLFPEDADINSNRNADKMSTVDKRITSNSSTWPRRGLCLRTQSPRTTQIFKRTDHPSPLATRLAFEFTCRLYVWLKVSNCKPTMNLTVLILFQNVKCI